MEHVSFLTGDRVTISGNYLAVPGATRVALLLHMRPATKASWGAFQEALAARGIASLAIDLRGHGESCTVGGETLRYADFSEAEERASIFDVRAAHAWLLEQGFAPRGIVLGGASIGANLALWHLAESPELSAAFLLSPGVLYRGIAAEPYAKRLLSTQRLFLAGAADDQNDLALSKLTQVTRAICTVRDFALGGHGTDLFATHPELPVELLQWISEA